MLKLLEYGFSPYKDNTDLEEKLFSQKNILPKKEDASNSNKSKSKEKPKKIVAVNTAFENAMILREHMMNADSFKKYRSRINLFKKWLKKEGLLKEDIKSIHKSHITSYLNTVLIKSSARNTNNTRTDIASLFQVLQDNDCIDDNFVRTIPKLKSTPKRNKTYNEKQVSEILDYVSVHDPILLLFIKFISYGLLRPIEVCRLTVEDVDIRNKRLLVRAKNKPLKIKIIPDILLKDLPKLENIDPKLNYFGKYDIGVEWEASASNKRGNFTARFKKIKDHFDLSKEYGLYSFRHTFITVLYQNLRKTRSVFQAKSDLMMITGHETIDALNKYLRDIDAELPEDFSVHFNS